MKPPVPSDPSDPDSDRIRSGRNNVNTADKAAAREGGGFGSVEDPRVGKDSEEDEETDEPVEEENDENIIDGIEESMIVLMC